MNAKNEEVYKCQYVLVQPCSHVAPKLSYIQPHRHEREERRLGEKREGERKRQTRMSRPVPPARLPVMPSKRTSNAQPQTMQTRTHAAHGPTCPSQTGTERVVNGMVAGRKRSRGDATGHKMPLRSRRLPAMSERHWMPIVKATPVARMKTSLTRRGVTGHVPAKMHAQGKGRAVVMRARCVCAECLGMTPNQPCCCLSCPNPRSSTGLHVCCCSRLSQVTA